MTDACLAYVMVGYLLDRMEQPAMNGLEALKCMQTPDGMDMVFELELSKQCYVCAIMC